METRLIVDSGANEVNNKHNLVVVPLTISFGEHQYLDDESLDLKNFLTAMDQNNVAGKTACPSIQSWLTALAGCQRAVIMTLTSGMSGTYASALQAKAIYQEKHPDSQIVVVDTRSVGPEMALVLQEVEHLLQTGCRFVDLEEKIAQYRLHIHLLFVLQSLHNLSLNGRVSPALVKLAKLLNIKIVGEASKKGKIEPLAKVRGMKRALRLLVDQMKKLRYRDGQIIIDYCDDKDEANRLRQEILRAFPKADIKLRPMRGLCSFYAERGGLMIGFHE